MRAIDVCHLGREHVICCWQVDDTLIDPGPESSMETLLEALGDERPARVLLTHIHFDHAGATGALVQRWPDLEVCVHERGAEHLVDPTRLVASARRLYGEDFDRLWGRVVPVPEGNLRVLDGGDSIEGFEVAYTPGHASHHVSYLHPSSGWAFVGDTAGVRVPPGGLVLPPTPPPDVDLEAWRSSLETIEEWAPATVAITHFGAYDDVPDHLARVRAALHRLGELARHVDRDGYAHQLHVEIFGALPDDAAESFAQAMPLRDQWLGLDRYWQRREG